jgi:tetratricopeptide (TPR) repeat protein
MKKILLFLGCTIAFTTFANVATAKPLRNAPSAPAAPSRQSPANPQDARAFIESALNKQKQNDFKGALSDFDQAIAIDAKSTTAYVGRGTLKGFKLDDFRGAVSDFSKAIVLEPQLDIAYVGRGIIRGYKLNDREGAVKDLRIAAKLLRAKGDTEHLKLVTDTLKSLNATE